MLLRFTASAPRLALLSLACVLAGCTAPRTSYRQIDRDAPAFKAAVAAETERLLATDVSPTAATQLATQRVTEQFVANEKERRTQKVAPLAEVLATFEKPRGCWAYTLTTTRTVAGNAPVVTIEAFDPFQPEERLWTLISRNGVSPDDKAQASHRSDRLRKWKRAQQRETKYTRSELVSRRALAHDLEVTASADSRHVTYTFTREDMKALFVGNTGRFRETFVADHATGVVVQRAQALLNSVSAAGGSIKWDRFQSSTDYTVIDPTLPPFVAKTSARFRAHFFGSDTGEVEHEAVYSDYRRVKCYDDRFEVKIGSTDLLDYLPSSR